MNLATLINVIDEPDNTNHIEITGHLLFMMPRRSRPLVSSWLYLNADPYPDGTWDLDVSIANPTSAESNLTMSVVNADPAFALPSNVTVQLRLSAYDGIKYGYDDVYVSCTAP